MSHPALTFIPLFPKTQKGFMKQFQSWSCGRWSSNDNCHRTSIRNTSCWKSGQNGFCPSFQRLHSMLSINERVEDHKTGCEALSHNYSCNMSHFDCVSFLFQSFEYPTSFPTFSIWSLKVIWVCGGHVMRKWVSWKKEKKAELPHALCFFRRWCPGKWPLETIFCLSHENHNNDNENLLVGFVNGFTLHCYLKLLSVVFPLKSFSFRESPWAWHGLCAVIMTIINSMKPFNCSFRYSLNSWQSNFEAFD